MREDHEALQVLGLARRAGRAAVGTGAVKEAASAGELRLVVLARDAGDNAVGRVRGAMERSGAERVRCGTRDELGSALGRGPVAVVGVTDAGLAERIRRLVDVGPPEDDRGPVRSRPADRTAEDETNTVHTS